jgi:hypothetical protein
MKPGATISTNNKVDESGMETSGVTKTQKCMVMLTVFVSIHGPLLLEWMPVDATIKAQRYCDTLQNLRQAIKNKRPGKLSRGVLMLHDNARSHAAHATRDTLHHFGWGVLDHPLTAPISPHVTITCLGH